MQSRFAELVPGSGQAGAIGDADLALAVIALGAGLQDAGQCAWQRRCRPRSRSADSRRCRCRACGRTSFSRSRCWANMDRLHARAAPACSISHVVTAVLGHVLELVGDDVDLAGEAGQSGLVVVGAAHMAGRDVARDRMVLGRIDDAAIAQPRRGQRPVMRPNWPPPRMPMVEPGGRIVAGLIC